jgi:heat-inducible transcriptional repressor
MDRLDERMRKVLCAVVQSYIHVPEPVGSRAVTKKYAFGVSPATIRNIMADLVEMGFLMQPHTSAGRVPTDRGYRFYVDSLVSEHDFHYKNEILHEVYRRLEALRDNIGGLLSEATRTLSLLSNYLGIAMSPRLDMAILQKIELIKFKSDQIAAIIVTDEGLIKNNIISLDSEISQRYLNRITNYLNDEFVGLTLDEIKVRIFKEMEQDKSKCDRLIVKAMKICRKAFSFSHSDLFISGLSEVLDLPDFADLKKIRELSRAIEDKHTIIKLLNKVIESDGVQILIGSENSMDDMKKLSVIVSPCRDDERPIGLVGIIGPTRMDYEKAICIVDATAKYITKILAER